MDRHAEYTDSETEQVYEVDKPPESEVGFVRRRRGGRTRAAVEAVGAAGGSGVFEGTRLPRSTAEGLSTDALGTSTRRSQSLFPLIPPARPTAGQGRALVETAMEVSREVAETVVRLKEECRRLEDENRQRTRGSTRDEGCESSESDSSDRGERRHKDTETAKCARKRHYPTVPITYKIHFIHT